MARPQIHLPNVKTCLDVVNSYYFITGFVDGTAVKEIKGHIYDENKTKFFRDMACKAFGLQDSTDIIRFHFKDWILYFPPDGSVNLKQLREFMEDADLGIAGLYVEDLSYAIMMCILDPKNRP